MTTPPATRAAVVDPALKATLVNRTPLRYSDGASMAEDRPAHVRAASSLAWIHGDIALVQDDANFLALLSPLSGEVRAIALPRGAAGLRQFDELRGNKAYKFDFEACAAVPGGEGPLLLAFGSGSTARRRQVLMVDRWHDDAPRVRLVDATSLYLALEKDTTFAGSDMNIEGACLQNDVLRFFGRGNGAARNNLVPVNATCDLQLEALLHYLEDTARHDIPRHANVVQYELGALDDVALGFTDAAPFGASTLYTATAEQSSDATTDGPVAGSVLGLIPEQGPIRYAPLLDVYGHILRDKVEGVLPSRTATDHAYVVIDADDPMRPSELCEIELSGPWQTQP